MSCVLHTFAIGDVHGRADLLRTLLDAIDLRARGRDIPYRVVFLGDIIDRGPSSSQAMNIVAETLERLPGSSLILGNHDWFPIRILDELEGEQQEMALEHWVMKMGGAATIWSYGLDPNEVSLADLSRGLPSAHLDLWRTAKSYVTLPQHILVHAGLAPGIPLQAQTKRDLMWIKDPFLSCDDTFEKIVVHGHSVTKSGNCEVKKNRIAIDTRAYLSGRLSAIHIAPSGRVEFIATVPGTQGRTEELDPTII
jgi:serine/threonine protein phosphatase 1